MGMKMKVELGAETMNMVADRQVEKVLIRLAGEDCVEGDDLDEWMSG